MKPRQISNPLVTLQVFVSNFQDAGEQRRRRVAGLERNDAQDRVFRGIPICRPSHGKHAQTARELA